MVTIMKRTDDFDIYWHVDDADAFNRSLEVFDEWANNGEKTDTDLTTKEIVTDKIPDIYNELTTGDKIRVGKAASNRESSHYYKNIESGDKKKGSSKTYHRK